MQSICRRASLFLAASAFLLFSCGRLLAQSATGEVTGTVTDKSGGAVAGATVKLNNVGTGLSDQSQTNSSGSYTFINVQPGRYVLSIENPGFKTAQAKFELAVNQTVTENLTLDVGSVNETVTVSSEAPLVQQSSTNLGTVIAEQAVKELPLNGRNFTQLMILTPGANPVSTAQGSGISFQDAGVTGIPGTQFFKPSLHGQPNRSVLYYLDGITNTDFRGSIYGVLPIIDAVNEFKVQSHNERTEFGGVIGGVVNLVSKSGTNEFHGSGWEFVRNNAFDARDPFKDFCNPARCGPGTSSTTGAPPAPYRQNEFGAALGGPIFKNKTFFYTAYEGWRFSKSPLTLALIPTPAELSGNFSQSFYNQQIYNPLSTSCTGSGASTRCTVSPFAGNIVPSQFISPAMQKYLNGYLMQPNLTGISGSNYVENRLQTDTNNSWQIRLDHTFNERNNMFLRLSQMWVEDVQPVAGTTAITPSKYHAFNFGGGFDHIFNPGLILDIRAGALMKPYTFNQSQAANGIAPATAAGFQNLDQYGGMVVNFATPYITNDIGQRGPSGRGNPGVNWDASLTWIKGNHNIKTGAQFIYVNRLQTNLSQSFSFSDAQTSNLGAARTGNSLASALLGFPSGYSAQTPELGEVFLRFNVWSGYIQDEWKVRPNLTVNLGLRYDYLPSVAILNGRLGNALNLFTQQYLIGASSVPACGSPVNPPCIPGGLSSVPFNSHISFAGPGNLVPPAVSDNWGPRIGIAWQVARNTVLRAGYGLFYDTVSARSQYAQNNLEASVWPWSTGVNSQPANVSVGGVWPGGPGNPLSPITNLAGSFPGAIVPATPWTGNGYYNSPDYVNPRSQQWNFDVQRQFGGMALVVAYVGSKTSRLDYTGYANASPVANPTGTPPAAIDARRLMPFMTPTLRYSQSVGISTYHALEAQLQRRFSNGLLTLVSYTWAKSLDNSSGWFAAENGPGGSSVVQNYFDPRSNYGQSAFNIPQLFTWSTTYELPFGRGKKFLNKGALSWVLGNWEANYVFLARSGAPYNLVVNGDIANISGNGGTITGYGRPNLIGDPRSACRTASGTIPAGSQNCFFNPAAFAAPVGSFGNFGRDVLRGESFFNLDFSLLKNIPFGERRSVQLRFESFNTLNFQILGFPGTTLLNANAGIVQSISSTPRQLQLAAKINF